MFKIPKKNTLYNIAWLIALAMFFLADRFLKNLALHIKSEEIINLIPNHLYFNFQANENIAFSFPLGNQLALLISLILVIFLSTFVFRLYKKRNNQLVATLFSFMILGAISNIFDRLQYSFVIDYFHVPWFAVFNLADAMISVSAFIIIFLIIFKKK